MPSRKTKAVTDLRSYARSFTELSVQTLAGIAQRGETDAARVSACIHLLDRGWGRCEQPITGADGGALEIVIRDIIINLDPRPQPKVIEGKPNGKT